MFVTKMIFDLFQRVGPPVLLGSFPKEEFHQLCHLFISGFRVPGTFRESMTALFGAIQPIAAAHLDFSVLALNPFSMWYIECRSNPKAKCQSKPLSEMLHAP